MRRINVVGSSGSGKSTVGAALANRMGVPHVEIDALAWQPGWVMVEPTELRSRVTAAIAGDEWVVDGNYGVARDLVWARADTVVWLDPPFPLLMWRIVRRTVTRAMRGQVLWGTNRESLRQARSREWIVWWAVGDYWRRRREYPLLFAENRHLHVIRLRSDAQTRRFLAGVPIPTPGPALPSEPHTR
jgi:adenylate kinase family enzyme